MACTICISQQKRNLSGSTRPGTSYYVLYLRARDITSVKYLHLLRHYKVEIKGFSRKGRGKSVAMYHEKGLDSRLPFMWYPAAEINKLQVLLVRYWSLIHQYLQYRRISVETSAHVVEFTKLSYCAIAPSNLHREKLLPLQALLKISKRCNINPQRGYANYTDQFVDQIILPNVHSALLWIWFCRHFRFVDNFPASPARSAKRISCSLARLFLGWSFMYRNHETVKY